MLGFSDLGVKELLSEPSAVDFLLLDTRAMNEVQKKVLFEHIKLYWSSMESRIIILE
jgi:hypothetical protein